MEHPRLVASGSFCWNPDCPHYGQVGHGNIITFGRTQKGTQRYQCTTCGKTFVETRGTVFYGRHHSQETIWECLALSAARTSLAAIHRVKGIKEETVSDWLREAAQHVEEIEAQLLANYQLTRAPLDALWTGEKGGMPTKRSAAPSGAGPSSTLTRACGQDERWGGRTTQSLRL